MRVNIASAFIFLVAAIVSAGEHGKGKDARAFLFAKEGRLHLPTSTKIAEAQTFFDQGMTLYYGFNHAEAVLSFRRALELDPKYAMAWWGIGAALGPNYNRDIDPIDAERNKAAYEAAHKALELAKSATPREQAYAKALVKRYALDAKADGAKLEADYRVAMKTVAADYPDDLDAAVLYAEAIMNLRPWRLWSADGKPAEDTDELVRVLEGILRRHPGHIGACHYYIHAMEASPFPERALNSADRLLKAVPWQGHLTHMPGHIYIHTGDFDKAALANELAIEADEAYFTRRPEMGLYRTMYYHHNIHFLAYARVCQGKSKEALAAARVLAKAVEPELEKMPMLEGFAVFPTMVAVRSHLWDVLLKAPEPGAKRVASRVFWHYGRALAFQCKGRREEALAEQKAFQSLAKMIPADAPFGTNPAGAVLATAAKTLDAHLAANAADAVKAWREAVKLADGLNYGEPPDWIFRPREGLGAALLRAGQADKAEEVFRRELAKLRRNGRALLGLSESLRAQKRFEEANLVRREYERIWPAETPLRFEDY